MSAYTLTQNLKAEDFINADNLVTCLQQSAIRQVLVGQPGASHH